MGKREYLLDQVFLKELDLKREKTLYARLILLNRDEEQIEEITGRVTSGSVNVDGSSTVRRTCSLSLVPVDLNIHSYYWGLKSKFKLEIGVNNSLKKDIYFEDYPYWANYPDIIWFPMGTYVISSFSTSQQLSSYSISISGKDKMVLLNGEMGGSINGPYNFGVEEDEDGNEKDRLIKDIIRDIVHKFAFEPLHNIIIDGLDDFGINLMDYKGTGPLYFIINAEDDTVSNFTLDGTTKYLDKDGNEVSLEKICEGSYILNPLFELDLGNDNIEPDIFYDSNENSYTIAKIEYGQTCGYEITELTYAGDLIGSVGQAATGILDKICSMLGGFEYFYDLYGRFVFQKKPTYVSTSWNSIRNVLDEKYADNKAYTSQVQYSFEDPKLVISFNNSPSFSEIKNDFSIWGTRTSSSGSDIEVHMRYAIDDKPIYYINYKDQLFTTLDSISKLKEYLSAVTSVSPLIEKNPLGLPDGWTDAKEWADAYKYYAGQYPQGWVGNYTSPYPYELKVDDYFSERASDSDRAIFSIEDFGFTSDDTSYRRTNLYNCDTIFVYEGKFAGTHGIKCTHDYTENYLTWHKNGMKIYLYKPQVPVNDSSGLTTLDYTEAILNLDWREIIYQMAIDYRDYNDHDDFYIKLSKNNYFVKNNRTGYEPYYTDMEGFWRQLYNPESIDGYSQKALSRKTYNSYLMNDEDVYQQKAGWVEVKSTDSWHSGITYYKDVSNTGYIYFGYLTTSELNPTYSLASKYDKNETYYNLSLGEYEEVDEVTEENFNDYYVKTADSFADYIYTKGHLYYNDGTYKVVPSVKGGYYQLTGTTGNYSYKNYANSYYTIYGYDTEKKEPKLSEGVISVEDKQNILNNKKGYSYENYCVFSDGLDNQTPYYVAVSDIPSKYRYQFKIQQTLSQAAFEINQACEGEPTFQQLDSYDDYLGQTLYKYDSSSSGYYVVSDTGLNKENYQDFYVKNENEYVQYYYKSDTSIEKIKCDWYNRYSTSTEYYVKATPEFGASGWVNTVTESPELLNFWFDFMDTTGDMGKYSVAAIGQRPKSVKDNNVKAIYFRETPNVVFKPVGDTYGEPMEGYKYVQLTEGMSNLFTLSTQGKTAKYMLDQYLYQYAYCAESISFTAIPIYYLQPNTRIFIHNENTGINGEYILSKISYQLKAGSTMTLQATKAVDKIY